MLSCKNCFCCLMYAEDDALCFIDQKWHNHNDAKQCKKYVVDDTEFDETFAEMAEFFDMETDDE